MAGVVGVVRQSVQLVAWPSRHIPHQCGPDGLKDVGRGISPLDDFPDVVPATYRPVDGSTVLGPADGTERAALDATGQVDVLVVPASSEVRMGPLDEVGWCCKRSQVRIVIAK